ncbi:UDP binding domain-containing protein [Endozoicomonas atrinae]|uniref:UDP binding domain-containing protein n=1 Tax=Endozoicomonas atrinae TaxID=1333660 RepID=UPI003B001DAF
MKVAILGFAFKGKPPTGDMRGSLVYSVIDELRKCYPRVEIFGHDYLVNHEEMRRLGVIVSYDINLTLKDSHIVILQNNHPMYKLENWEELRGCTEITLAA